jgi:Ca2+-binding RTX toxin-like protein
LPRTILPVVLVVGCLLLTAGAALAATVKCDGGGCLGTPSDDALYGTPLVDKISGGAGDDVMYGGGENDELNGGSGADTIRGNAGDDVVYGGPGSDKISGKAGRDTFYGGYGNDNIHGSLDGEPDHFVCGPDTDQVVVGPGDTVASDCETVKRNPAG